MGAQGTINSTLRKTMDFCGNGCLFGIFFPAGAAMQHDN